MKNGEVRKAPMSARRMGFGRVRRDGGGALLEMAIAIPILIAIIALVFDTGLGFGAAQTTSNVARSAARSAALAGDTRLADFNAVDAVRANYVGSDDALTWVTVFRVPTGTSGDVPADCRPGSAGVVGLCNVYDAAAIEALASDQFPDNTCTGAPDANWCPLTREMNDGDSVGIGVWVSHEPTVGLLRSDSWDLEDRAVFALYFE